MSRVSRPQQRSRGSDVHRLLEAAEAGQRADILTWSSGHLGPHSLSRSQTQRGTQQGFWRSSQIQETPKSLTQQQRGRKTLIHVRKKEQKVSQAKAQRSRHNQAPDCSSHADRGADQTSPPESPHESPPESLPESLPVSLPPPVQLRAGSKKESRSSLYVDRKQQVSSCLSDQGGQNNEGRLKKKQQFCRRVIAKELWAGTNAAEMHERKLQKELKKLSAQSWPSKDRLAVFSDVFDDVCKGLPVFGRILREIKTDYDAYVNYLMAQSSQHDVSLENPRQNLGDWTLREEELDEAGEEVKRLEPEVGIALEENKRVTTELQDVTCVNRTSQVLNIQQQVKEKVMSHDTDEAAEKSIKDLKAEMMNLTLSNECVKNTNEALENRAKATRQKKEAVGRKTL